MVRGDHASGSWYRALGQVSSAQVWAIGAKELLPESRSYETAILPSLGKALHIHCKAVATENSVKV